jgi:hypothetical protein
MPITSLPAIETFGNNDITTLASAAGPSDTIISVATVSGFPTDGQFRLLIDTELLLVTGYDLGANQFQVTRGAEGSTAASHSMGAQVVCILTRGSLLTLKANIEATLGSGVEFLIATPGSSQGSPVGNLNLGVAVSVLVNQTGGSAFWHLPDGTDGIIHEIVLGAPGSFGTNNFVGITSTNGWSNDLLDLNNFFSVRLVWITAASGWVAVSTCQNVNNLWD